MTDAPMPLEWHSAYRGMTWLLDWIEGRGASHRDVIELPVPRRSVTLTAETTDIVTATTPPLTLTRRRCAGGAPYVGKPFAYSWWAGIDNLGRTIAGDSTRWYDERPPQCWAPGFEDYASLPDYYDEPEPPRLP